MIEGLTYTVKKSAWRVRGGKAPKDKVAMLLYMIPSEAIYYKFQAADGEICYATSGEVAK